MAARRLPLAVLLVGLLVAAAVAGDRHRGSAAGVHESPLVATMPAPDARSSAWYCAGGPVGSGPSGDRVTISNTGSRAAPVAVDVMVEGKSVAEQLVSVAARSSTTLSVSKFSAVPSAALVVQPLAAGVVVAQGFATNGDIASAPCATRSASTWYFAAGSSVSGTQDWLSLLDPYPIDEVVDVQAYTENGLRAPSSLQDLIVHAHSRLSVRVDSLVAQQKIVAVQVHVRNGQRVVATQSVVHSHTATASDASLSIGSTTPSRTWLFADDRSRAFAVGQLVLANPAETDATVRIALVSDLSAVIQPRVVKVPAATAVAVDFSRAVPAGGAYTLTVSSSVAVVAETRITYDPTHSNVSGLTTEVGSTAGARRWWFAGGPFANTGVGGNPPTVPAGYDVTILMKPGATAQKVAAVASALGTDSHVRRFRAVSRAGALAAFVAANRDNPTLVAATTASDVSPSFDVVAENHAGIGWLQRRFGPNSSVAAVLRSTVTKPPVVDDVVVFNTGKHAIRVSVVATAGGSVLSVVGMTNVSVAPGRQVTISLLAILQRNAAAAVTATGPVVAERFVAGPNGATRSPGVPEG